MKVFKFGGASIRNARAVINMANIIASYSHEPLVVVVSAMGKTTNALEEILNMKSKSEAYNEKLLALINYHLDIINVLIPNKQNQIYQKVDLSFEKLVETIERKHASHNQKYDQVISFGELISSRIVAAYLQSKKINMEWLDARQYIRTNEDFREAKINWPHTKERIGNLKNHLHSTAVITQGFIGGTMSGFTSTLGREGSDFTAAILANALDAESLTIWKDVPGVLNADPKMINDTIKYKVLSYQEAAEMTYYGASVIHPKTIKPLADKNIPLLVRSFDHPKAEGTTIHHCELQNLVPAIIFKTGQTLITFKMQDLDFINEKNLSVIFHILDKLNIKISMMQNSAVSFTVCFDDYPNKLDQLLEYLQHDFDIRYNRNLTLITIKNFDQPTIDQISKDKVILVEQKTRTTYQIVVQ